jgi:TatD DNase family protein
MFVDTHAHIYSEQFDKDRHDMLEKCSEIGVKKIYMPNIDHTSIDDMMELEARYPSLCISMMGLHPCSVNKDFEKELYLVEEWLGKRKFAAVGEIGIDLYWDKTFRAYQEEAFRIQVNWAKKYKLPIVIHCRESFEETITLVEDLKDDDLKGVFHCFTGSERDAKRAIDLGFYLGIGGVATFKNGGLDKVLPNVGAEFLLLETDSPYLAPTPHRGKRNEPTHIPLIAQKVADLKEMSIEELAKITTDNSEKLFSKGK